ncbi:hypothetical protein DPMN_135231 [Dreissena polymorpha]|uniref:Uncharacterized protein n=1 Tax=Dreissena polymorpha TaxID=45954 RepID=A0A9D4JGL8_DREPO|nr:hypothetical protein DPMN_135231 [Dreissena polymorpha]
MITLNGSTRRCYPGCSRKWISITRRSTGAYSSSLKEGLSTGSVHLDCDNSELNQIAVKTSTWMKQNVIRTITSRTRKQVPSASVGRPGRATTRRVSTISHPLPGISRRRSISGE